MKSTKMDESEWTNERGKKWLSQLSGMEKMLKPIDEPLIQSLRIEDASRIADVGCGAGGTTLEIRKLASDRCTVHGYDISKDLIEEARVRGSIGEKPTTFTMLDVATKTPDPADFDRLVSRFGVMFFTDAAAAFRNLARWLRPGGRFSFAVWGDISENPWVSEVRTAISQVMEIPPSNPDEPGPFRYA